MWPSFAKINFALHVGALQPDGYHPVDTLCVFLDAGDRLTITPKAEGETTLTITGPYAAELRDTAPKNNLVMIAARLIDAATDVPPADIALDKRVPPASGIGGGTSNGATALVALNALAKRPLESHQLVRLARRLGADGPVCTAQLAWRGQTFRAQGIGERVAVGPKLPPLSLCIANPGVAVPTGPVFKRFDAAPAPSPFALPDATTLPTITSVADYIRGTRNDLAPPAIDMAPRIAELQARMAGTPGCLAARMSGSGATVFGVFAHENAAQAAARRFSANGLWAVAGRPASGPLRASEAF